MRLIGHVLASIALIATVPADARETAPPRAAAPHNVILVVVDGLRGRIVDTKTAPELAKLRDSGSYFPNSHSLFPTFTTANASALATGHQLGDTGDFSNTIYTGSPVAAAAGSVTPFLENDTVLGEVDQQFRGDYLEETTVLAAARHAGYGTAAIGKLGPALIQDHLARSGDSTIVIDDSTGGPAGIPLSNAIQTSLRTFGLPVAAPSRGANGNTGSATTPGTTVANLAQQDFFIDAATKVVLPALKARGRPFAMVFWSRDPDGTQHNQGDSLNRLSPGINGPSTFRAIRNADNDLGRLRAALETLGLTATTDIIVTSDHGFSTISKQSATSSAATGRYADVPAGFLPPGFLALDLAASLHMPMFDPEAHNAPIPHGAHPSRGNALLGTDAAVPELVVAANGGSDLIYLPGHEQVLARSVVAALLDQDYVSGIFVDDTLGPIPGTLPLSSIGLKGRAATPTPAIVVNFRTQASDCATATNCMVEIADTTLQQGQGMHGSFGRGDTLNFTAAIGPDFKHSFIDPAPVSNADLGQTMMRLLKLSVAPRGHLLGRVLEEAISNRPIPVYRRHRRASAPAANGLRTVLQYQTTGTLRYYDTAGFAGRTLGLPSVALPSAQRKATR
ncbi:alkaline phosphatase family protein [Sphingomonas glacialis]|uniref:Alkaline phosphatase family protein n=1 Tax=Sphingomonas glacialis TaxID=658225 RepID=A0A502FF43_9SPHN|nr:alkaline phosphatase family protein [Sphingomonas glacialis]TPG48040.1 alkaline phosphatase family protein [Sphingomonas glacialis]